MSDFRWSFSQWETYNSCPAKWKYKSVLKLPGKPPGPAAARGLDLHDRVERYIKGEITPVELMMGDHTRRFGSKKAAPVAAKYVAILDQYRYHEGGDRYTERKYSIDTEWYVIPGIIGGKKPWLIAVLDAMRYVHGLRTLYIGEWKSGSPKDTHVDQRKLYSLIGLREFPMAEQVITTTYYLEDTAPPAQLVVKPTAEEKLKALWQGRVEQMQSDRILAPKPNEWCKWCDYSRSQGGPCQFGG